MRRMLAAAAAATMAVTVAGTAPAASAAVGPPDAVTVAIRSPNTALYAWPTGGTGWVNLGGKLAAAPAAVHDGTRTHYIVMGTNQRLYHRTDTTGWAALGPAGFWCTDLGAGLSGDHTTITVGCRGGNAKLYALSFPTDTDYPYTETYTNLGGVIQGAPAVISPTEPLTAGLTGGDVTFLVQGGTYPTTAGGQANTYARTTTSGWARTDTLLPQVCTGPPAAATRGGDLLTACQTSTGIRVGWRDGAGDVGGYTISGTSTGSLAAAITETAPTVAVTSPNTATYTRTVTFTTTPPTGTWTNLGGKATPGATATTPPAPSGPIIRVTNGGDDPAQHPSLSSDGHYLVFASSDPDLVSGDENGFYDVFLYDREADTTTAVVHGNSHSFDATISGDGRYIAFMSDASDIVDGDGNELRDLFVYDRDVESFTKITKDQGLGSSGRSFAMSDDGRYLTFISDAGDLVAGDDNNLEDVFVYDQDTEMFTRLTDAAHAELDYYDTVDISGDGQSLVIGTEAAMVAHDTNASRDIYLVGRETSAATPVTDGNGPSEHPSISGDGRYVAFESSADNLVAGDTNENRDVFLYDIAQGATVRVTDGDSESNNPVVSEHGETVAFQSYASDLVPHDTNGNQDVFSYTSATGRITRLTDGDSGSIEPTISADGRYTAFLSEARNLTQDEGYDNDESWDVFLHDRGR